MNKEVKKMLVEAKKELLEKKEQKEKKFEENCGVIEQLIWRDFIVSNASDPYNYNRGYIYSGGYKFCFSNEKCDLESDVYFISGISKEDFENYLAQYKKIEFNDEISEIYGNNITFISFKMQKEDFEKAMDTAYNASKKKKKKSKSKKLSRDYHNIDTKTKGEEKDK